MIGVEHHIVEHEQLAEYVHQLIVVTARSDGIYHCEDDESYYHHLEKLRVMVAYEGQEGGLPG